MRIAGSTCNAIALSEQLLAERLRTYMLVGETGGAKKALEAEVLKLEKQKQEIESLDEVGEQVKEFCARATERLDGFSFEERRLALEALQIKVVVGRSGVKLFGVIPRSYATIGQTSG